MDYAVFVYLSISGKLRIAKTGIKSIFALAGGPGVFIAANNLNLPMQGARSDVVAVITGDFRPTGFGHAGTRLICVALRGNFKAGYACRDFR